MTIASRKTMVEIAQALGLDTNRLVSYTVSCDPRDVILICAIYLAETPVDGVLEKIPRNFRLTEDLPT